MRKKILYQLLTVTACLALLVFILAFCRDKDYFDPNYTDPVISDKPMALNFSTTQDVKLTFDNAIPEGLVFTFEIYADNPLELSGNRNWVKRADLIPLAAGFNVSGEVIERTIPAYVKEVYLYSGSLFMPLLMHATIKNGMAEFGEVDLSVDRGPISTRNIQNKQIDRFLKENLRYYNFREGNTTYSGYKPEPIDLVEEFPVTVQNNISGSFPEGFRVNPKYYIDASMYLKPNSSTDNLVEVWVSLVYSRALFNNALCYFTFKGTKEQLRTLSDEEKNKLKLINIFQFAKVKKSKSSASLRAGDYIKLKYYNPETQTYEDKFPTGVTIGWILYSNGFKAPTSRPIHGTVYQVNQLDLLAQCFYSIPEWNWTKKKEYTIFFMDSYNNKEYICFGFEDTNRDGIGNEPPGDGDCNDVIFHVRTVPGATIDPPPLINPIDGERHTVEEKKGILSFEDNWPRRGDYDMNDVVAAYTSKITYTQRYRNSTPDGASFVSKIEDRFSLIHSGANYHNSFKIKIEGITLNKLKSLTLNGQPYIPIANDGGFIIEVCPLVAQGSSIGGGAIPPYKKLSPEEYAHYDIVMEFIEGAVTEKYFNTPANSMSKAPYNTYISPSPHIQVHLPNYPPAKDENMLSHGMQLFGTHADRSWDLDSDSWTGYWYVSGANNSHPFALHFDMSGTNETFVIPAERKIIEYTYPNFTKWVDSGCKDFLDWYKHPDPNAKLTYN
ncbi:LruC domain-containing protein [Bacteroides sp. 224]|uniref:LruC domain-containing protein n=1 Tax=Bacteroides sp. 224 TaxID=2302936 RepID=UPI0013D870A7|nr:LruC domain-containing protein [Bacteroides sp. 224]NDV67101.1 LruC domain-containing protein [Bacteroides sp. 224]